MRKHDEPERESQNESRPSLHPCERVLSPRTSMRLLGKKIVLVRTKVKGGLIQGLAIALDPDRQRDNSEEGNLPNLHRDFREFIALQ